MTTFRRYNNVKNRSCSPSRNSTCHYINRPISIVRSLIRNSYCINFRISINNNSTFCTRSIAFYRNSSISPISSSNTNSTISNSCNFNRTINCIIPNCSISRTSRPTRRNWNIISGFKFYNLTRIKSIKIFPNISITTTTSISWF